LLPRAAESVRDQDQRAARLVREARAGRDLPEYEDRLVCRANDHLLFGRGGGIPECDPDRTVAMIAHGRAGGHSAQVTLAGGEWRGGGSGG
jgi:hypothetical protein